MISLASRVIGCVVFSGAAACSSSGASPSPAGGAGAGGVFGGSDAGGLSGEGPGGGGGQGGAAGTQGSGGAGPRKVGQVLFIERIHSFTGPNFSAQFTESESTLDCETLHETDDCFVRQCAPSDPSSRPDTFPHAGAISYEAAGIAGAVQIEPDETGVYRGVTDTREDPFSDAVSGTVRATGGDVPAFEQPLPFPLRIVLEEPVTDSNGFFTVERDRDLVLVWSRPTPGVLVIFSVRSSDETGSRTLYCRFDSEAGGGTVPASMLADAPHTTNNVSLLGLYQTTVQSGDFEILLAAGDQLVNPEKNRSIFLLFP